MSHPVPATLYRIAAAAGCGSAAVLLINAAKRAEVIPTSAFTQLVAPLAQILALALVTGLYLAFGRRTGTFGLVAFLLNAFALSSLVGVEFVINLVFKDLPAATVQSLRAGSLGVALTTASVLFLLGTLTFVAAMLRGGEIPRGAARPVRGRRHPGRAARLRPRGRAGPRSGRHGSRNRLAVDPAPRPIAQRRHHDTDRRTARASQESPRNS